jgi:hypothetical protein
MRPFDGAIDCDIHPAVPGMSALVPYLDEYWREAVKLRGIERRRVKTIAGAARGHVQREAP